MSCYHLSRFLFDVKMNDKFSKQASTDLDGAMQDYDLTAEEKQALRFGDPRKLRQLGVHGMLCLYVKRLSRRFPRQHLLDSEINFLCSGFDCVRREIFSVRPLQ